MSAKLVLAEMTEEERNAAEKDEDEEEQEGKEENKAGYTANSSCGRLGRGGNARFHTFRLVFTDRATDQSTNRPTDGQSLL